MSALAPVAGGESVRLLRQKNRALHRELHKLRADVRYLTTALAARDGQLSLLTKRALALGAVLSGFTGDEALSIAIVPAREGSPDAA